MVRNVQADASIQEYAERCVQERRAAEVRPARQPWPDYEFMSMPDVFQLLHCRWERS